MYIHIYNAYIYAPFVCHISVGRLIVQINLLCPNLYILN